MVYIDTPRVRKGRLCCHMVADSLPELHAFARALGLSRLYFHGVRKNHPHYDLFVDTIIEARRRGAVQLSSRELLKIAKTLQR